MLLRDPEGNYTQSYDLSLQSRIPQRSWGDNANVPASTNVQTAENSNSLNLSYRESQLHAALSDALSFESAADSTAAEVDLNNPTENENKNYLRPKLPLDFEETSTLPSTADFSPDEGLFDYEDEDISVSSSDISLRDDKMYDPTLSDVSRSHDGGIRIPRGIHNPNYPGFQHLAYTLQEYTLEASNSYDNISNICEDPDHSSQIFQREVNNNFDYVDPEILRDSERTDLVYDDYDKDREDSDFASLEDSHELSEDFREDLIALKKDIYETIQKPIAETLDNISEIVNNVIKPIVEESVAAEAESKLENDSEIVENIKTHMDDAYMSDVSENINVDNQEVVREDEKKSEPVEYDINCNETKSVDDRKSVEKVSHKKCSSKKKSEHRKASEDLSGAFDVYNIETAMPSIDLDAIECHLKAAKEEERRRRNDREEIRRRLAMGTEHDEYYSSADRPGRKPSLQTRLQSGMNLQICFMNETVSDTESPSDAEIDDVRCRRERRKAGRVRDESLDFEVLTINKGKTDDGISKPTRPSTLALGGSTISEADLDSKLDFFECQARLQTEARMALAQAKEVARMQMEIDRQRQDKSPITEMLRCSLEKAGLRLPVDRRRVSRQMLTDVNVAQLQIIVNELHTQIEYLNESLVELLIARDELHMGQDSMLVDIEDLTRHLGAKDPNAKVSRTDKIEDGTPQDNKNSNRSRKSKTKPSRIK